MSDEPVVNSEDTIVEVPLEESAPVESIPEEVKPVEQVKPNWRMVESGTDNIVDNINSLEENGYEIFTILGSDKGSHQIMIIGKLKG